MDIVDAAACSLAVNRPVDRHPHAEAFVVVMAKNGVWCIGLIREVFCHEKCGNWGRLEVQAVLLVAVSVVANLAASVAVPHRPTAHRLWVSRHRKNEVVY